MPLSLTVATLPSTEVVADSDFTVKSEPMKVISRVSPFSVSVQKMYTRRAVSSSTVFMTQASLAE